ncbi:MAG: FtsW/RodA/SpoVE family cell cycle protein [Christensenellales bacterium]
MQAVMLCAAVAPLGLLTTLALPRFLPMDSLVMALTNFLCGVGVVVLYTVSPARGARQAVFYALGLAVMLVMSEIVFHVHHFRGLTLLGMVLGIGALVLPLAFGEWNNGAKNWVQVPLLGSFQPSEIVKLSVVLALAYFFSAHRTVWQMMPALVFAAACLLLLMMQRDLGTALIYYLTTLVLFYVACGNVPLTVVGLGGGVGAAALGYQMFAHVKVRVAMWRNPWSDPTDKGYQIIQALLAIGSGGLFGVGLGQGTPEKIPAYYNDFIFAVICEQLGQVFGVLLLAVYVLLILRGVTVVARARRSFEMLLGCGVLAMLGIQTFMIVAGVIKMIPLTGVTMPFLSYGGSSLLSCMAMIGILHGASARAQENLEEDILCVKG